MSESFPDGNPSASPGQASSATWSPGVRPGAAARPLLTAEPPAERYGPPHGISPWTQQAYGAGSSPVAPARRRAVTLPVGVMLLVAVLVGGGAVAWTHRDTPGWGWWPGSSGATEISMPSTLFGYERRPDLEDDPKLVTALQGLDRTEADYTVAVYSRGAAPAVVVATVRAKERLSPLRQEGIWAALRRSATSSGNSLDLVDRAPGPLGGRLACGTDATTTLCAGVDPDAVVLVFSSPSVADVSELAAVRGLVEHRAGVAVPRDPADGLT